MDLTLKPLDVLHYNILENIDEAAIENANFPIGRNS